jgi:hypothetical protein
MKVLTRVAEVPEDVQAHVEVLALAELVQETRFFPDLEYSFRHAIFQEVAYQSLLAPRRKQLHRLIGEALEQMTSPTLSEHGNALAYHFSRSDVADKAVKYLIEAGDRAAAAFSNREALASTARRSSCATAGANDRKPSLFTSWNRQPPYWRAAASLGRGCARVAWATSGTWVYHLDISRLSTDGYGDGRRIAPSGIWKRWRPALKQTPTVWKRA